MNKLQMQTLVKLNKRRERRELIGTAICTALLALLIWLFFMIAPVEASNSPKMVFGEDVKADCFGSSQYACYRRDIDTIFFSVSIPPKMFPYVFFHEYGHALTLGLPYEVLKRRYGSNCYEDSANSFYFFVMYPKFRTPDSIGFWGDLLTGKRVP